MDIRDLLITVSCAIVATPCVLTTLHMAGAQVMESGNYTIQADSINFGGGSSASNSYWLEATAGEIATGDSESASYSLHAGYQNMGGSHIAMTVPSDVTMSPALFGVTGGVANGSTTVTVTTDSAGGYVLNIRAETSPALQSGSNTIADYVPAAGDPDLDFTTGTGDAHFGYSPEGADIVDRFRDDSLACNTGVLDTALSCWAGLTTSDVPIAQSAAPNTPSGTDTTVHFRVGLGSTADQPAGMYTATTTFTAVAQ